MEGTRSSWLLLASVNYVEHYGLTRQRQPDGRLERVGMHHSWSSNDAASNAFLFNLQHHADHHANAAKPYPALASSQAARLPCG